MNRRYFTRLAAAAGFGSVMPLRTDSNRQRSRLSGVTLPPGIVPKFIMPLVKPPAMPLAPNSSHNNPRYDVAVRQFRQLILPAGLPETTVWSYGSPWQPGTVDQGGTFHYPAFTIENQWNSPTRITWRNELVDSTGNYLPHLLPVDQTMHWANPPGRAARKDSRGEMQAPYSGPVPIVTHVHGAHTTEDSDGYPEAWYLPDAANIPAGWARTGSFYDYYNRVYRHNWAPGSASFRYPNDQPASTLWYHDHALGMTRLNVYAGPAGFYLIRGGPWDRDLGFVAPRVGDNPFGEYTEIPIAIQDRSFNFDGSLFYPDSRAFFEGLDPSELRIPFIPDTACDGMPSDVSPIWNPEFFGNMIVVNGFTWPFLDVEQRRYRFRFLNGCNSRFLILKTDAGTPFYQIGAEQSFLPAPVELGALLMAPAERADVIMDFTNYPVGTEIHLLNIGPDEPFGGGIPGIDFDPADPASTGLVMQFRVKAATSPDTTSLPASLPVPPSPASPSATRKVSLNEEESSSVRVSEDFLGDLVLDCADGEAFGPTLALLGTVSDDEVTPLLWMDRITENPSTGATEDWAIHNFTADAHPIHLHLVKFQVTGREDSDGFTYGPAPWETGFKDTVVAYPGEITRIRMTFDVPGFYVWHCHIVEHEDNEMMRPFHVGPIPGNAPAR